MTSLTFRDRALDTIHEAVGISGGSFLDIYSTRPSRSCRVPLSIQILHGWLGEPSVNSDC